MAFPTRSGKRADPSLPRTLTPTGLRRGARELARRDPDLGGVVRRFGIPPMWDREPGFSTLIHIILEQQVSLASARAAHQKLLAEASPLTPERFLEIDDATLKRVGFSRQKAGYGRHLSRAILEGRLDLEILPRQDDETVHESLLRVKGIGAWTANIYLLMALRRPDAWPIHDLALEVAAQRVKRLARRPAPKELQAMAEAWRPWRAVAARILWHFYLSQPKAGSGL